MRNVINFLHLWKSTASSISNYRVKESFSTTSVQVFFGLPQGLTPFTWWRGEIKAENQRHTLTSDRNSQCYGAELADTGMDPDGMAQRQHVAAPNLADHLVTTAEVEQLERVDAGLWRRQQRVVHHLDDPVIENAPVTFLQSWPSLHHPQPSGVLIIYQ